MEYNKRIFNSKDKEIKAFLVYNIFVIFFLIEEKLLEFC